MAAPPLGSRGGGVAPAGKGTTTANVEEQILAVVLSISNLLHLMHDSSPSQARLAKLPGSLLAKASVTKNTAQILQQLPQVISSLDEQMDSCLQSFPHLKTVSQLLTNMENVQLKAASHISIKEDGGSTDES